MPTLTNKRTGVKFPVTHEGLEVLKKTGFIAAFDVEIPNVPDVVVKKLYKDKKEAESVAPAQPQADVQEQPTIIKADELQPQPQTVQPVTEKPVRKARTTKTGKSKTP